MHPVIIFDFDGVILESVSVKTMAFQEIFSEEGEAVKKIERFHIENGGLSRFDKFKHIYRNILHRDLSDDEFQQLCNRFSHLVFQNVIKSPFVLGAEEFLKKNYRKFDFYIVSATPEDELRQIVKNRGLNPYFKGVYGAPGQKPTHIQKILSETHRNPEDVVFIGDAINDLNAARACGIRFIGRVAPDEPDNFSGDPAVDRVISSLSELDGILHHEDEV